MAQATWRCVCPRAQDFFLILRPIFSTKSQLTTWQRKGRLDASTMTWKSEDPRDWKLRLRQKRKLKAMSSSSWIRPFWENTKKYQTKQTSLWNLGSANKTNSPVPELPWKRLKNWRLTNARIATYRNWKTWGSICFSTWSWSVCGQRRSHAKGERHSFISQSAIRLRQLSNSFEIERHLSA